MKDDLRDFGLCLLMLSALFAVMFWIGTPAHSQAPGQPACAPANGLLSALEKQYGETVTAGGTIGQQLLVILTNRTTGSFTILIRNTDGIACIMAGGTGFALADPVPMKGNGL